MREHDVPYHMRFQIDTGVRCGYWYGVRASHGHVSLAWREDLVQRGEPRICAFDIETTKLPLQFPNAEFDQARPQSFATSPGCISSQGQIRSAPLTSR